MLLSVIHRLSRFCSVFLVRRLPLMAGMVAGADSIDDRAILRRLRKGAANSARGA
ncbi:hypothetical protein [Arthrobacter methylotrophus]|uniref:hypothetical protein n=1 Tax=Arthrobacter methylotrophus TaxID=121291 RepID=UPI0031EEE7BE